MPKFTTRELTYREIKLSSISAKEIIEVAGTLDLPIRSLTEQIPLFLQNVETAVCKLMYKRYYGALVKYQDTYKIGKIEMHYTITFSDNLIIMFRKKVNALDHLPVGHLIELFRVKKDYGILGWRLENPIRKLTLPLHKLPLLINSPYPSVRTFVSDRLAGVI